MKEEDILIYLISDRSFGDFFNYDLEIWRKGEGRFQLMERIHLFRSSNMEEHQVSDFRISFGKDDCHYHVAESSADFIRQKREEICRAFKEVGKDIYLSKRSEIMKYSSEVFKT